jgi:hypothetical protein
MNQQIHANEKRFWGANDSETLQNVIDYASANGVREVVIPRENTRTGEPI